MKKGKCIYCKEEKDLNREHAFPQCLLDDRLRKTKHEWIIDEHVCKKCNSDLGKLDAVLGKKSPLALTWDRIQNELSNKTQTLHSSIYHKRASGTNPLRLLFPNPNCENRIMLHEVITENRDIGPPVHSAEALCPQMILTQYVEGQSSAEVIAANYEKLNAASSDQDIIVDYDEHKGVYYIFENTYIFPPNTSAHFFDKVPEFKSKFMPDFPNTRYDLMMIFPEEEGHYRVAKAFYNAFESGTKEIRKKDEFQNSTVSEQFSLPLICDQNAVLIYDRNAVLDIARAIAKIAFHCFLYHYREFNGHEPIFNDIREFIYLGSPNRFVHEWPNPETENLVYPSNEHLHGFCVFREGNNIACQIEFFTGLLSKPFSYGIILAGYPENSTPRPSCVAFIPFFVHPESEIKRR